MGRKPKCKICKKELNKDEAFVVHKGKTKQYYCSKEEYEQEMEDKIKEQFYWNKLYDFVKNDVLNYESVKNIPQFLIIRLRNLRNGTMVQPTMGIVKQSKAGYSYEIILKTFEECLKDIKTWTATKSFKNEQQKINYIMAIIENHINEVYDNEKREKQRNLSSTDKVSDIDVLNVDFNIDMPKKQKTNKPNLMDLLDENDLD